MTQWQSQEENKKNFYSLPLPFGTRMEPKADYGSRVSRLDAARSGRSSDVPPARHSLPRPLRDPYSTKKSALRFGGLIFWSGLRVSNPPPRPWQGRALPNELNPRFNDRNYSTKKSVCQVFSEKKLKYCPDRGISAVGASVFSYFSVSPTEKASATGAPSAR